MIELLDIMGIKTKSGTIEDVLMERISSLPPQEERKRSSASYIPKTIILRECSATDAITS